MPARDANRAIKIQAVPMPSDATIITSLNALTTVASLPLPDGTTVTLSHINEGLDPALVESVSKAIAAIDPWKRYGITADRIEASLHPAGDTAPRYLLLDGDAVAGLITLKLGWMFGTYLNLLAVLPAHQGRGIGRSALDWLEARARDNGERNLFVVASAFNARGLDLYQRHGFVPIANMPGLIDDSESEILLRKRLI